MKQIISLAFSLVVLFTCYGGTGSDIYSYWKNEKIEESIRNEITLPSLVNQVSKGIVDTNYTILDQYYYKSTSSRNVPIILSNNDGWKLNNISIGQYKIDNQTSMELYVKAKVLRVYPFKVKESYFPMIEYYTQTSLKDTFLTTGATHRSFGLKAKPFWVRGKRPLGLMQTVFGFNPNSF